MCRRATAVCTPRVSGSWIGANAKFDGTAHKVMLDITPSDEMREALKEVGVEVLGVKEGSAANGRRMVRESGDAGTRQSRGFGHREQLPLELMIVIPELAKGTYMVEVVTQYSSNGLQKESRTTLFDRILTVS